VRALRFQQFGGPEVLEVADLPRPVAAPGEVVVAIRAASINPSDVKNVEGKMEGTTLPRTPGRDFAGVVVEGPADMLGTDVWGAGGDIGFTRDGSHAEYIAVPVDGVAKKPERLSYLEAAACGVNFVTAWAGVATAAHLEAGETILVTGSAGGVGSSVIQLARWMGARSIGVDRAIDEDAPAYLRPDVALASGDDILAAVRRETGGRGVDVVYDTVGAPLIETNLGALAHAGRYVIISSAGDRRASFDILDFYHKRLTLIGVDTRALDTRACAVSLNRMRPGFEAGALQAPAIGGSVDIARAEDAYFVVSDGAKGKVVITASAP
jgi:NADPH:quinone reductase-like Zn-dependent oxidoreductase